jgi:hypothetical protein
MTTGWMKGEEPGRGPDDDRVDERTGTYIVGVRMTTEWMKGQEDNRSPDDDRVAERTGTYAVR